MGRNELFLQSTYEVAFRMRTGYNYIKCAVIHVEQHVAQHKSTTYIRCYDKS